MVNRWWQVPGRRYRQLRETRRTAIEALRLATETARALERVLQREVELERDLAALRESRPERDR
ncbi:hypothetical protein [Micromonospora zhanjiangensis]|uniref:Uncharacterized protein n=1 Tax=Micromonospora zhanjiangensis TaxID=1522057 RepID=A0ABV8KMT5_9ACTN